MTTVEAVRGITGGVDTHRDVHVAAALDPLAGVLGSESFPTDVAGYQALLGWLETFGNVTKIGVEGTGSYGSGLAGYLRRSGVEVIEVDRPDRQKRRRTGKSDPLDAVEAARAALSGRATGSPKSRDGAVEAIRVLIVAKRSARQARVKALILMRHLGFSAPERLRCRFKGLTVPAMVAEGIKLRPTRSADPGNTVKCDACGRERPIAWTSAAEIEHLSDVVKHTCVKLGIPEAERTYLSGVTAQADCA